MRWEMVEGFIYFAQVGLTFEVLTKTLDPDAEFAIGIIVCHS